VGIVLRDSRYRRFCGLQLQEIGYPGDEQKAFEADARGSGCERAPAGYARQWGYKLSTDRPSRVSQPWEAFYHRQASKRIHQALWQDGGQMALGFALMIPGLNGAIVLAGGAILFGWELYELMNEE